ncbi:MAG: AbrB/MazE/SpoVT family DNA-binding domain-containing protein [Clostridiales bacterium]|nr:AbrB/MazE/SpoVT family DNA-binding domain-containing protein [Clostridiales bacterium]
MTPEGKYMTTIKIGPKGQIIIPKEVRDMFGYNPGDVVLLMADKERGVAIVPFDAEIWNLVNGGQKQ